MRVREFLRFIRPGNCVMTFIGSFTGSLLAVKGDFEGLSLFRALIAGLAAFLVNAGGNVLNDIVDVGSDRINHPDRPLVRGTIDIREAGYFSISLFLSGIMISIFPGMYLFLLAVVNSGVLFLYERYTKRRGFSGNLSVAYLAGSVFVFGGLAVGDPGAALWLALLSSLATLSREIIKDIEDVSGDVDRITLPKKIGIKKASFLGVLPIATGILLSPFPFILGLLSYLYLFPLAAADMIFALGIYRAFGDPAASQSLLKKGMLVALVGFLAGLVSI